VKSLPDVEMRSGIDHVITVLRRATARVDPNRRLSSENASLALILAERRAVLQRFEASETTSVTTADAGEFSPSRLTALMEITSR